MIQKEFIVIIFITIIVVIWIVSQSSSNENFNTAGNQSTPYYFIQPTLPPTNPFCESWARNGDCPSWILPYCPNECNKYNTPPPTNPPPTNPPPISTIPIVINTSMGQNNQSIINFKELTVRENPAGGWDVWINSPLEINHNVSIPGMWGGIIQTKIDTNWNITVTYTSPDEWLYKNQQTYGWMKIETDLQRGTNLTTYNSDCCGVTERLDSHGEYYMMRERYTPQQPIIISQSNNSNKLTFRNKENFVKIGANIVGFYANTKQTNMEINILDTLTFGSTNTAT